LTPLTNFLILPMSDRWMTRLELDLRADELARQSAHNDARNMERR